MLFYFFSESSSLQIKQESPGRCTLSIQSLYSRFGGAYTCSLGDETAQTRIYLVDNQPPELTGLGAPIGLKNLKDSETRTLKCAIKNAGPKNRFVWYIDEHQLRDQIVVASADSDLAEDDLELTLEMEMLGASLSCEVQRLYSNDSEIFPGSEKNRVTKPVEIVLNPHLSNFELADAADEVRGNVSLLGYPMYNLTLKCFNGTCEESFCKSEKDDRLKYDGVKILTSELKSVWRTDFAFVIEKSLAHNFSCVFDLEKGKIYRLDFQGKQIEDARNSTNAMEHGEAGGTDTMAIILVVVSVSLMLVAVIGYLLNDKYKFLACKKYEYKVVNPPSRQISEKESEV